MSDDNLSIMKPSIASGDVAMVAAALLTLDKQLSQRIRELNGLLDGFGLSQDMLETKVAVMAEQLNKVAAMLETQVVLMADAVEGPMGGSDVSYSQVAQPGSAATDRTVVGSDVTQCPGLSDGAETTTPSRSHDALMACVDAMTQDVTCLRGDVQRLTNHIEIGTCSDGGSTLRDKISRMEQFLLADAPSFRSVSVRSCSPDAPIANAPSFRSMSVRSCSTDATMWNLPNGSREMSPARGAFAPMTVPVPQRSTFAPWTSQSSPLSMARIVNPPGSTRTPIAIPGRPPRGDAPQPVAAAPAWLHTKHTVDDPTTAHDTPSVCRSRRLGPSHITRPGACGMRTAGGCGVASIRTNAGTLEP